MNDLNNENDVFEYNSNKKSKPWIIIIILLVLVVLGIIGYSLYEKTHDSKTIFRNYVNKVFDFYSENRNRIDYSEIKNNGYLNIESDISIDTNYKGNEIDYSKLKDYTFNNLLTFIDDEKLYTSFKIKEKNNDFLNLELLYEKESLLIKCKEILDKVIELPLNNINIPTYNIAETEEIVENDSNIDIYRYHNLEDILSKINNEDIDYAMDFNKKIINNALKKLKYEGKKDKLNNVNVYKSTAIITNKDVLDLYLDFLRGLLDDNKMMTIMSKLEIDRETIEVLLSQFENVSVKDETTATINLYTYPLTGKFVKIEIIRNDKVVLNLENNNKVYTLNIGEFEATYDENKGLLKAGLFEITFKENELIIEVAPNDIIDSKIKIAFSYPDSSNKNIINIKVEIKSIDEYLETIKTIININVKVYNSTNTKTIEGVKINYSEIGKYENEMLTNIEKLMKGTIFEDILKSLSTNTY